MVAREPHNLKVGGSIPSPATRCFSNMTERMTGKWENHYEKMRKPELLDSREQHRHFYVSVPITVIASPNKAGSDMVSQHARKRPNSEIQVRVLSDTPNNVMLSV